MKQAVVARLLKIGKSTMRDVTLLSRKRLSEVLTAREEEKTVIRSKSLFTADLH